MNKPVLFCYDGSDGSKTALGAAAEFLKPADAVVLVVWMPAAVELARAGSFLVDIPNEGEVDDRQAALAQQIAEEGAARAQPRLQRLRTGRPSGRISGEDDRRGR
jgi:nucleotide-binding universal stress UspA family protein